MVVDVLVEAAFANAFLKGRERQEKDKQEYELNKQALLNKLLVEIGKGQAIFTTLPPQILGDSCKFCAAPLESIRCEYCGRWNRN